MSEKQIKGYVHSLQSLGTVDGPGVRFVVFMQGCNLRCGCCHNPDTWQCGVGKQYTPAELADRVERYKEYFGEEGGVTVSGGEPLLQAEFVSELFSECHKRGINTCLDTSGSLMNDKIRALLEQTDRVLLDIKYATDELYVEHVGCHLAPVLEFLSYLNEKGIATTVRQVIIPTLNAGAEDIRALRELTAPFACVDKTELLPFKKICAVKYDEMGIDFKFKDIPTPSAQTMQSLKDALGALPQGPASFLKKT